MAQKIPHVYLAGPITGTSGNEMTSWREEVKNTLFDICTFDDPTTRPVHVSDQLTTKEREKIGKTVVKDDESGVDRADIVLLNLKGATRVSIGSIIEMTWAAYANKEVVLVIDEGNIHKSDLLLSDDCVSYITDDLQSACDFILSYAQGEKAPHNRAFSPSNSRTFNILVQIMQNHAQNNEQFILNLRHYNTVSIDALFLLALAYKMNVESVICLSENSVYDHAMIREIVSQIRE